MNNGSLFKQVTIVGVGLIGGSLGMAIKKHHLAEEVVGLSPHHSSLAYALESKAIDRGLHDIQKAVEAADLVIMATPVKTIISLLPMISKHLKRGAVVTDVGSIKTTIVDTAERHFSSAFFVGSHPLAGSEKAGAVFANPNLFQHSLCIVTPTPKTNRLAEEKVRSLWESLGATVKTLTPSEHDKILAFISHLPHLLAYALIDVIPGEYLPYAASGLKDTTRIAASSPNMWNDICMTNSKNIVQTLDEVVKKLSLFRKLILAKAEENLIETFKKAKIKRESLDQTPKA